MGRRCRADEPATRAQYLVIDAIDQCLAKNGYQPSYSEIAEALNVSVSAVVQRLIGLERKGYIANRGVSRALRILKRSP